MTQVSCPQCAKPIDLQARYCAYCGVDLAIAAVIAERTFERTADILPSSPLAPEILVPRLGSFLVENGMLKAEDLARALAYQEEKAQAGTPVLLGKALRELGLIDAETLDKAVTMQILELQAALQRANRQLEERVKERTQQLEKAIEKMAELNQLKANFIATISHELRTPLAHMKGYLDLLHEGGLGSLNETQAKALTVIRRAEERLERLIEDLIQFSLAARGELQLEVAPMQVEELIQPCIEQAMKKAQQKHIEIAAKIGDRLPRVVCDAEKISWVIAQLLDNAIKFTPENGSVKVGAYLEDRLVTIEVVDNGIGIQEERIAEIFEPFHQLDGSTTRRYGGTGLGLALSNRILSAHGVQMVVHSQFGKGSSFSFSLPIAGGP